MAVVFISAIRYFMLFLQFVIIARVLMSWFPGARGGPFSNLVHSLSEPVLGPVRRLIQKTPLGGSMLDISPIFALLLLRVAESLAVSLVLSIF